MSLKSQISSLTKAVDEYDNLLKHVSEEMFSKSPADGGWSYSETFSHIFQANLGSLIAAEKCILGTGIYSKQPTHWKVRLILFLGMLPPGKFKAPERIASMVKLLTKEEAANLIVKFKKRLADIKIRVDKADKYQKIKHPRLGLLNARQWIRFIEIHTRHHVKQLGRIERKLKVIDNGKLTMDNEQLSS